MTNNQSEDIAAIAAGLMADPCPLCGTEMLMHKHCFSHPMPKQGDCLLRYYSFGVPSLGETMDEIIAMWNSRAHLNKTDPGGSHD